MFTRDQKQAQVEMTMCKYLMLIYRGYCMAAQRYRDRDLLVLKKSAKERNIFST